MLLLRKIKKLNAVGNGNGKDHPLDSPVSNSTNSMTWADSKLQAEGGDVDNVGKNTWASPKSFGFGKHSNSSAQKKTWLDTGEASQNQPISIQPILGELLLVTITCGGVHHKMRSLIILYASKQRFQQNWNTAAFYNWGTPKHGWFLLVHQK